VIRLVFRKMLNKKWLMAALLIGNILLVSIAASSPMYTKAALERMLSNTFTDYVEENGRYASTAFLVSTVNQGVKPGSSYIKAFHAEDELAHNMAGQLGLQAKHVLSHISLGVPIYPASSSGHKQLGREVDLGFLSNIEEHIEIISGNLYSDTVEDGVADVIISQKALINLRLVVGQELYVPELEWPDGKPVSLRVAGVFESDGLDDSYWYKPPSAYSACLFMAKNVFETLVGDYTELNYPIKGLWFVIMDHNGINADNAEYIYEKINTYREYHKEYNNISYRDYYSHILEEYIVEAARISVTLQILQIPIYALLAAFIFMAAGQIIDMESSEISVVQSRGASREQIILIYLLQSGIIAVLALVAGIPLSALICQILGSANVFLEFVSRQAMKVSFTGRVFGYAFVASLFSVCAMLLPVLKHSKVSIVNRKQKKRRSEKPLFQRFYIDIVLLAVSLYGLYAFNGQKEELARKVMEGAGLDPLMFLSSSLFIISAALICLRLIPAIVYIIYRLGKRKWKPEFYASFLWILRTRRNQIYIITFLIVTIAIGIFNSQAARTINTNEEERIRYLNGAEIVLQEPWQSNKAEIADAADNPAANIKLVYTEPDTRKYYELDGIESMTKVIFDEGGKCNSADNYWVDATIMGINTKEFGHTVDFNPGLLPVHWYEYLNAISQNPTSVLVSSNMKDNLGYGLGDTITYKSSDGFTARGVIYGFVDFWPTYKPLTITTGSDGVEKEVSNYIVVANFSYLQSQWGLTPYQLWIKAEGTSEFIYAFALNTGTSFTVFRDTASDIIDMKNNPIFQGTNGILTVGFVVSLLLCAFGFLIYWILSIRSRQLLFGVFRAMGMSMGEIIRMLVNEQLYISGLSVVLGIVIGLLASRLYIPLVQIAYSPADKVIPLKVVSESSDMARLLTVVFLVMAVCMLLLGSIIKRIKISQALKLGED